MEMSLFRSTPSFKIFSMLLMTFAFVLEALAFQPSSGTNSLFRALERSGVVTESYSVVGIISALLVVVLVVAGFLVHQGFRFTRSFKDCWIFLLEAFQLCLILGTWWWWIPCDEEASWIAQGWSASWLMIAWTNFAMDLYRHRTCPGEYGRCGGLKRVFVTVSVLVALAAAAVPQWFGWYGAGLHSYVLGFYVYSTTALPFGLGLLQ